MVPFSPWEKVAEGRMRGMAQAELGTPSPPSPRPSPRGEREQALGLLPLVSLAGQARYKLHDLLREGRP